MTTAIEKRAAVKKAENRGRYERRVAKGVCPRCGGTRDLPGYRSCLKCLKKMRFNSGGDVDAPLQKPREELTPENAPRHYERIVTKLIRYASRPVPEGWFEDFAQDMQIKLLEKKVFERAKAASEGCTNGHIFLAYVTKALYRHSLNWMRTYRRKTGRHIATDPACELLDGIDSRTLDLGGHDFWLDFYQYFPEVAVETARIGCGFEKAYWAAQLPRRDRCRMAKFLDQYDIAQPF
jgi:hypothetical protein